MGTFEAFLTVREFAGPETYLGPIPTAVVILKAGQTARNTAFCQGYMATPTTALLSQDSVASNPVPLRWLLKSAPDTPPADCAAILSGYDFDRATLLTSALSQHDDAPSFSGVGPFIVEFMPDGSALVIDASTRPTAAVRHLAPQWLALDGDTLQPEEDADGGCLLRAAGSSGTMAEKAVVWMECEFPNGFDKKVMKIAGCAAARAVGGFVQTGASLFFCKDED